MARVPENGQGGECLFLVHWLSYEKLNLCILCAFVKPWSNKLKCRDSYYKHLGFSNESVADHSVPQHHLNIDVYETS